MAGKNVAIAGASGAVGIEFMSVLEKLNFPVKTLKLLATKRSAGKKLKFKGEDIVVEEMTPASFKGVDIALFSAGSSGSASAFACPWSALSTASACTKSRASSRLMAAWCSTTTW